MEKTPQEMPLQFTPNPLKNLVFLKEVFQLGVSISSQPRYDHFDTSPYEIVRREKKKGRRSARRPAFVEAPSRFELESRGFAVRCLTTWLWRQKNGAGNEIRTRYLHLGKVALCQMSYARKWCLRPELNW